MSFTKSLGFCAIGAVFSLCGLAQAQTEEKAVNTCLISIEGMHANFMLDAKRIKSFNLHKKVEDKDGHLYFLSLGNYPVMSIQLKPFGDKKIFFKDNETAEKSYANAVAGLKKCESIAVYGD